jgi:hypothetical protein
MSARTAASALLAVVFLAALPARGDEGREARAAREFAEGQRAFVARDYTHAGESFEAAYRDQPHYAPLWNAARSWHRAGEIVRAANLYARYLREAPPDAPDRDQATAALREVSARTARVEIHTASEVTKARVDGTLVDGALYVAPGEHVAAGDSPSGVVEKSFRADAGQTVSVTLTPAPKAPPPPRPAPTVEPPSGLSPVVAVVGGVLAVLGTGLTIASGLDTVAKKHDFLGDTTQSRLDDAYASQTRTNIVLGTTIGVAAVTGVIAIFFTDWRGRSAETLPISGSAR